MLFFKLLHTCQVTGARRCIGLYRVSPRLLGSEQKMKTTQRCETRRQQSNSTKTRLNAEKKEPTKIFPSTGVWQVPTSTVGGINESLLDDIPDLDSPVWMETQGQSHINSAKSSESEGVNKLKFDFDILKIKRDTLLQTVKLLQDQLKQKKL